MAMCLNTQQFRTGLLLLLLLLLLLSHLKFYSYIISCRNELFTSFFVLECLNTQQLRTGLLLFLLLLLPHLKFYKTLLLYHKLS